MIWVVFVLTLILTLVLLANLFLGYQSAFWPTTKGRIVHSAIQARHNPYSSSKTYYYHPIIIYEYAVGKKTYRSRRLGCFLAFGEKRGIAEAIISRFESGASTEVYYLPLFPGYSYLIPGVQQVGIHATLIFISAILSVSSGIVLFNDNPYLLVDSLLGLFSSP